MQTQNQEVSDLDFLLQEPQTSQQSAKQPTPTNQIAEMSSPATGAEKLTAKDFDNLPNYSEVVESAYIFDSLLQKYFPDLIAEKDAAVKVKHEFQTNLVILKNESNLSPSDKEQIKAFEKALEKIENLLFNLDKKADEAILSLYATNPRPAKNEPISITAELPEYSLIPRTPNQQSNQPAVIEGATEVDTNINQINEQIKFATPQYQQLALCLAGINATPIQSRNPVWLAKQTGLSIAQVREAILDQNYKAYVCAIAQTCSKEIVRHGLNQKIRRLQEANLNLDLLHQVRYERGMLSTTPEEVSDEELLELGLDPKKRDLQAMMIPGASSGLLQKTPVVLRNISNDRGGSRTQIVQTYTIDTALLRETRVLMEYIAKELGEYGNTPVELNSQAVKTYKGFDPSQV